MPFRPLAFTVMLPLAFLSACQANGSGPTARRVDPRAYDSISGTELSSGDVEIAVEEIVLQMLSALPEGPGGKPWRILFERFENDTSQVEITREYVGDILTHRLVQEAAGRVRLYVGSREDLALMIREEQEAGIRESELPPNLLVTPDLLLSAKLTELARMNELGRSQHAVLTISLSDLQGNLRYSFQQERKKTETRHRAY